MIERAEQKGQEFAQKWKEIPGGAVVKATIRRNRILRRPAIKTVRSWRRSQTRCRYVLSGRVAGIMRLSGLFLKA